jgi:pyruvate kinase
VGQSLAFSYGVHAVDVVEDLPDWREFARQWLGENEIAAQRIMIVSGPSPGNPDASHRMEFIRLAEPAEPS